MDKPNKPYMLICSPGEIEIVRRCVVGADKDTIIEVVGNEYVEKGKTYLVDVKKLDPLNFV